MPVLIYIDHTNENIKKASFEAMSYGADIARQMGTTAEGLLLGKVNDDLTALGKYGISKVNQVNNSPF